MAYKAEILYVPRKIGDNAFEVAKFEDGSARPIKVHTLELNRRRTQWFCDCERVVNCRHFQLLEKWKNEMGEKPGVAINYDTGESFQFTQENLFDKFLEKLSGPKKKRKSKK